MGLLQSESVEDKNPLQSFEEIEDAEVLRPKKF